VKIQENISLKPYNTFGLDVRAKQFVSVNSITELKDALNQKQSDKFILGGGSNMLLTKDIKALVIHINLKGINIVSQTDDHVIINAKAGENWHEFVLWCINHGFGGVENLSLIPGNVGTAPIQNIGAYGVELKDVFVSCNAIHIDKLSTETFSNSSCKFGYRDSIFKSNVKNQYIITDVTFKLTKKNHQFNIGYGAITNELENKNVSIPSIKAISDAVIAIRQSKLPDPKEIGNSGSFFKNPVISSKDYEQLLVNFPNMPKYPVSETTVKVPAGWLIEKTGFKGKRFGNYGVHEKQALVLVNYGNAQGEDILKLAQLIKDTIHRIFGISLETEVNII